MHEGDCPRPNDLTRLSVPVPTADPEKPDYIVENC
jgi:hypothetical protein